MLDPKFVTMEGFYLVGKMISGKRDIGAFWQRCIAENLFGNIPNKVDDELMLGVCCDYVYNDKKDMIDFNFILGTKVNGIENVPNDMVSRFVEPAEYAVFTVKDGNIVGMWQKIEEEWFVSSGYERDEHEEFEYYDRKRDNGEVDLYVPIKRNK